LRSQICSPYFMISKILAMGVEQIQSNRLDHQNVI
jgi:hypothetical protein